MGARFITELAVECLHYGSGNIKAKSVHISVRLKRPEKAFGLTNPWTSILEINTHVIFVERYDDRHLFSRRSLHCPETILGNVQKNLQQAIAVGPDQRQITGNLPIHAYAGLRERSLYQNPQLVQHGMKI